MEVRCENAFVGLSHRLRFAYESASVSPLDVGRPGATRAGRKEVGVRRSIFTHKKHAGGHREGEGHEGREREEGAGDHGCANGVEC